VQDTTKIQTMTISAKKQQIQNQKKNFYLISKIALVSLIVVCFAVQYHKEIVTAVEFVEECF
jgi:hypothetical protein